MAVDRLVDHALGPVRSPPHEGQVAALQRSGAAMVGELGRQRPMGAVVLRHHHQTRGVLVEPMDDSGAAHPAYAGQGCAAMRHQGIDQRAAPVASSGMDHEAARLVDDDDVGVLVNDRERDVFRSRLRGRRLGTAPRFHRPH